MTERYVAEIYDADGNVIDRAFTWETGQTLALEGNRVIAVADDGAMTIEMAQGIYDAELERWADCYGREIPPKPEVRIATCGACGQSWNDAVPSSVTPAPAGRCPFEYDHEPPGDELQPDVKSFDFRIETPQGTYTPFTDGHAVGFAFDQDDQPTQFIFLNPSSDSDDGQPNVFVYKGESANPSDYTGGECFINIGVPVRDEWQTGDDGSRGGSISDEAREAIARLKSNENDSPCPNCGGPEGYPSGHAVGCPHRP